MYCNCKVNVVTVQISVTLKSSDIFHITCCILLQEAEERLWAERIAVSADRFSQLPLYWKRRGGKGAHKVDCS